MTWNTFKDYLKLAIMVIVAVLVIGLLMYSEMAMWDECRQTHPFWFCWRVLSK